MKCFSMRIVRAVFMLVVLTTPAFAQDVVDRIVAVINGEVVTLFELNQRFKPFLDQLEGRELLEAEKSQLLENKRMLLDRMVEEILLRQEADRLNMTVSEVEVQNQMRQVRERLGLTETQFQEQLRLQGLSKDLYEQRMRDEIQRQRLIGVMIRRKVVITSEEIRQYYESRQADFFQERRVRLALILFASMEQAEEVLAKVRAGETAFEQAARTYSVGPGADQGGDIGSPAWKDLAPEWRQALEGLKAGEVSDVFQVQGHPAVLKLLNEEIGEIVPLAEVEDRIREKLMEPRLEARLAEYLEGLRNKALIDVRL